MADDAGMSFEEAANHSLGQLKMMERAMERNRSRDLLELLQVVAAGASAPYSDKGIKAVWAALQKKLGDRR